MNPWEVNPSLTPEKLRQLANFITQVRDDVVDLHDTQLGDTDMSTGFRAYECCRSRIIKEAEAGTWPWLKIVQPTHRFTFSVDGTPIRFRRSNTVSLGRDRLEPCLAARNQMSLLELVEPEYAQTIWFFIVQTDYFKFTESVSFVGYLDGQIICNWEVPLDEPVLVATQATHSPKEPIVKPKPTVKLKTLDEAVKPKRNER